MSINLYFLYAIVAAALYALNTPISKLLLSQINTTIMAGLLYLGAGIGTFIIYLIKTRFKRPSKELSLIKSDLPFVLAMVALDVAAPILLMLGLKTASAANVSLLNNFEIVATAVIALIFFKEYISICLWSSIILVTTASLLLSFEDISSFSFSFGSVCVLMACICWGIENNCTRHLSNKDPLQIVIIKGFGSGMCSLTIGLLTGGSLPQFIFIISAMLLGFISVGLSVYYYVKAQRVLGAAKVSACYAVSPFIGTALSLIIFRQLPNIIFWISLIIMIIGVYFATSDNENEI